MELFIVGVSVDQALQEEIERETGQSITEVVDIPNLSKETLYSSIIELPRWIARELANGETTALIFHRECSHQRLLVLTAALQHFSIGPEFIEIDGGWSRSDRRFIYHISHRDTL